jgi:hypothetical protein
MSNGGLVEAIWCALYIDDEVVAFVMDRQDAVLDSDVAHVLVQLPRLATLLLSLGM